MGEWTDLFPIRCAPKCVPISAIIYPWLDLSLPPRCPQVVWCHRAMVPSTGCVVSMREDWAIFCHAGSGRVGGVWSVWEKSLEMLRHGWELNPGHGEDRQWDSFSHWAIMTDEHLFPGTTDAGQQQSLERQALFYLIYSSSSPAVIWAVCEAYNKGIDNSYYVFCFDWSNVKINSVLRLNLKFNFSFITWAMAFDWDSPLIWGLHLFSYYVCLL